MSILHDYPYTDFHDLNLDWVINRLNQLDLDIKGIEERATKAAIDASKLYIDAEMERVLADFNQLKQDVRTLETNFNVVVAELRSDYNEFIRVVNAQITLMSQRIDDIRAEINADIIGVNARTDLAIEQNNEYIFSVIENHIAEEIKVINFFTGERVTIQNMFNYLALLHVDDGATLDFIASKNKTVQQIVNINASCTDWVLHGKTLLA